MANAKMMVEFFEVPGTKRVKDYAIGEKVTLEVIEVPSANKSKYGVALKENDTCNAYAVWDKASLQETGTTSGSDYFNALPADKRDKPFQGRVDHVIDGGNGRILVEVDLAQFDSKPASNSKQSKLQLKVSGSIRNYQAKSAVIKAFKNGQEVLVTLSAGEEDDNGVKVIYSGMPTDRRGNEAKAGVIRPTADNELDELKELIKNLTEITAKVVEAEDSSYTLEVRIDADVMTAVKTGQPIPTLDPLTEQIVKDGIATQETVDAVKAFLQANNVQMKTIINVFESYKAYDADSAAYIPKKPATEFVDEGGFVNRSVNYVLAGPTNPVRFTGEAGTGKNLLITTLAWVFQRPLFEKAVNAEIDKYDMLGSKTTDVSVDEHGRQVTNIVFEAETFIKAMEVGGFCNLDEINTGNPGVLTLIHPVIDGRSYIDVPGYGRVRAHDNFGIFSTMNIGYAGTQALNKATRDRFTTLVFEPNKSIESILRSHADTRDADNATILLADKLYRGIHRMVEDQELDDDCLTVRGFIKAVRFADALGIRESLIDNVANNIDERDYRQQVIDFIDTIC